MSHHLQGRHPQATMAAQLTRDPEPLYQICPDVPPPLSAIIMQCLAKEPDKRPPTAEALMSALDSITTSSGDVKTPVTPMLPAVAQRKRRLSIAAAITTVALGSTVAVFAAQRGEKPDVTNAHADTASGTVRATVSTSESASAKTAAKPAPSTSASPLPVVLTRADSLAIAAAVRQGLAEEQALRGAQHVSVFADSIIAAVRKTMIDSIIKATVPRGVRIPVWSESQPSPLATPSVPSRTRRVVVIEPRATRREDVNSLGRLLVSSIRRSLVQRDGYHVIDEDSVRSVLDVTRTRSTVERMLKADVVISPTFVGTGDTLTALVTLRDASNPQGGTRIASGKVLVSQPEPSISPLVELVGAQLESLRGPRGFQFVAPKPPARSGSER